MEIDLGQLPIGALASQAGVSVETIRFYQRQGLIREPSKPSRGIRRYATTDVARVRFIKSAQRLGFSLSEVAQLLTLEDGVHCELAAEIAAQRLKDVRSRLAHLLRVETVLSQLVSNCQQHSELVHCPLIAAILDGVERDQNSD